MKKLLIIFLLLFSFACNFNYKQIKHSEIGQEIYLDFDDDEIPELVNL